MRQSAVVGHCSTVRCAGMCQSARGPPSTCKCRSRTSTLAWAALSYWHATLMQGYWVVVDLLWGGDASSPPYMCGARGQRAQAFAGGPHANRMTCRAALLPEGVTPARRGGITSQKSNERTKYHSKAANPACDDQVTTVATSRLNHITHGATSRR
jgi:hypothetical protein